MKKGSNRNLKKWPTALFCPTKHAVWDTTLFFGISI